MGSERDKGRLRVSLSMPLLKRLRIAAIESDVEICDIVESALYPALDRLEKTTACDQDRSCVRSA